jgi:anthranilate phosphoribosyltransferase
MLGCRRALVLRGVEGDPELSIAAVTKLLEVNEERVIPLALQPKDVGLPLGTFRDMAGFPRAQADQEAALIRRILHNQVRGGPRDWVMMNAAMLLYAAGKASSISAGVPLAQQALDSGAAARKLDDLVASAEPAGAVPAAGSRAQQGSEGSPT